MAILALSLLLAAASSPPPDDDDDPRSKAQVARPAMTAPAGPPPDAAPGEDDDDKRATSTSPTPAQSGDDDDDDARGVQPSSAIVVTARRLDAARTRIDAALGSTVYSLTNDTIEDRPGGETGSIAEILAQAPGVTLSGRALAVRGSPANQVRINNVIVPEAISDPADHLSARLADTSRLVTGTLPAQFGFAPAGVISITTKNGLYQHGGQAELFACSDGMVEPAVEWAGSAARTSLFASGSFEHDRSTVADAAGTDARDRRNEVEGLGFADHVIDDSNRVSMIAGGSLERHRFGPTSIGSGTEHEGDGYVVGTFQHSSSGFTVQSSVFAGVASDAASFGQSSHERRGTFGTQIDATDELGAAHTLRFGLLANGSTVDELQPDGRTSTAGRTSAALYAQDEWRLGPSLTVNPGARIEWLRGSRSAARIEPRASLVRTKGGLSSHIGYARYAAAPPLGEPTHAQALGDERDDYVDAGVQQRIGSLTVGIDAYRRSVHNLIAEHQTPGSAIADAFAFGRARIGGVELSATFARGAVNGWANLSLAWARARTVIGGQGLFSPEVLTATAGSWVPLASDRPVSASGGVTWRLGKLSLSGDVLAASGAVRTLRPAAPNGARYPSYAVLGAAAVYHVRIAERPADLRLDLTNLTNARYVTSNAANLEGGWTMRGRSRAITIGIEQGF